VISIKSGKSKVLVNVQPVRLSFQPLIFSQPAVFFSHDKSANSTFSRLFSAQTNRLVIDPLPD
jgi:hypothetical protein